MLALLVAHVVAASLAPMLVRWLGPRACYLLAMVPAAGLGWALIHSVAMREGRAMAEAYPWVRHVGLALDLRMTTLSWLTVLLVSGGGCAGVGLLTSRFSRRAAVQALVVTTFGGLAMLVGIIMLGEHAGSYRWSQDLHCQSRESSPATSSS